jgi:hypothetical protein
MNWHEGIRCSILNQNHPTQTLNRRRVEYLIRRGKKQLARVLDPNVSVSPGLRV